MKSYSIAILLGAMLLTTACEVEKTQEGRAPEVNIEGGQMPKYDVKTPDVDVGTEKREVTVPTVDIDLPEDDDIDNNEGLSTTERDE